MNELLLLDSDVLIDYLRSRAEAIEYLENLPKPPIVSAITVAELYAGVREGAERKVLDKLVKGFTVIPITEEIAVKGGLFKRDYFKSHGVGLADALIAATSEIENAIVVTLNKKHYPMFSEIIVPYQKS